MTSPVLPRRSGSRSRRSNASFSDLRLAPLSTPAPPPPPPPQQQQTQREKPEMSISLDSSRTPGSIDHGIAYAYKVNHPSYLAGRSAPSTPGILSRSSSRKGLASGALSRKFVYDDEEDDENEDPNYFQYAAVRTNQQGGVDSTHGYVGDRGKSKSESGLNSTHQQRKPGLHPLNTASHYTQPLRGSKTAGAITPRGRPSKRSDGDDNWLIHATSFTTSLLQESKASSLFSSHSSTTHLPSRTAGKAFGTYATASSPSSSDSETSTPHPRNNRHSLHMPLSALPSALDGTASPLRSPALPSAHGWSSRFGSRVPSTTTSRRNSRANIRAAVSGLATPFTPHPNASRPGTAGGIHTRVLPDFVDGAQQREMEASLAQVQRERDGIRAEEEGGGYFPVQGGRGRERTVDDGDDDDDDIEDDDDDDEEEVARLARTPGFGLGGFGIIDAFVGMGGFGGEETTDGEAEVGDGKGGNRMARKRGRALDVQGLERRTDEEVSTAKARGEDTEGGGGGGGWSDAAWLLSVASKALLS
ncbi:hypothetical protein CAC42_6546 [Sphaceloma murrayae]|uniref:Uncharacterized protein n=1 Tax=Sphaceloma murrayae TaxID=2082308 RepID=A0A2K1QGQ4_9PEZI|nr:hypothetical protein CAC42_6546 [Sphaceloma murrayae]